MIVRVVMSKATRVLAVSLDLSTLVRQATTYRGPLLALTMTADTVMTHGLLLHCNLRALLLLLLQLRSWGAATDSPNPEGPCAWQDPRGVRTHIARHQAASRPRQ